MNNIGLLLVSHGYFAKAALSSAQMIVGKQENVIALGLMEDTSLEQLEQEIWDSYEMLRSKYDEVVVLCDIYGGTPFNAISRNLLKGMKVQAFTGLSLPLLIDLLLSVDLKHDEIKQRVLHTHAQACAPIELEISSDSEEECCDL